ADPDIVANAYFVGVHFLFGRRHSYIFVSVVEPGEHNMLSKHHILTYFCRADYDIAHSYKRSVSDNNISHVIIYSTEIFDYRIPAQFKTVERKKVESGSPADYRAFAIF